MKSGISIDVGTDLIKIVSYKKNNNSFVVKKAVSFNSPDCELRDGKIVDVSVMAKAIREVMVKNKIKGKNVNFILSSNKVITREVNYPDLPAKKLEPVIKMNSAEYFPVNLDDYTMNYSVLEKFEEDLRKMVRTNTVVVPTEIANSYVQLAKELKLKIDNITYSENAMMNYALLVNDPEPYMTVDIGSSRTSVAIVRDGKVVLNRTLTNGIKGIIDIVKEKYDVDYDRALEIVNEKEFIVDNTSLQDTFTGNVVRIVNIVVSGVARLLDYYSSKHKEPVSTIYVSGMGSYVKGLQEYISNYFGIETKKLDSIKSIKSSDPDYNNRKNIYANAIGAVYSDVNLIPETFISKKRKKQNTGSLVAIIVLVLALGGALLYFPFSENLELQKTLTKLQTEKNEIDNSTDLVLERDLLKIKNDFYLEMENTFSNNNKSVEILKKLEEVTPTDIDYSVMKIAENGVIITCSSETKNSVANYLEEVKKIKVDDKIIFDNVFIPNISFAKSKGEDAETENNEEAKKGRYEFTIGFDFKNNSLKEEAKEVNNEK